MVFIFRKKAGYVPVYLRQTTNDLTGEHSCVMLNVLHSDENEVANDWLAVYWTEFRKRFISLLHDDFRTFTSSLALSMLTNKARKVPIRSKILVF